MAWTQAQADALAAAIATGAKTVHYADRTVTYHDLDEMRSLLAEMLAQVAETAGTRKAFRLASTRKGFDS